MTWIARSGASFDAVIAAAAVQDDDVRGSEAKSMLALRSPGRPIKRLMAWHLKNKSTARAVDKLLLVARGHPRTNHAWHHLVHLVDVMSTRLALEPVSHGVGL